MKIFNPKKIISTVLLGTFALFSCVPVYADDNASDPIANIANSTNNSTSNGTNNNNGSNNNNNSSTKNNSNSSSNQQSSKQSQDAISNMLLQSVSLMGIAYKWGGNTPDTGMDCSGFVRYVFKKSLGINLPRTAAEMAKVGKRININDLQPGDLIFFNTRRGSNTHIGIYLGGNKFIQSPRTGENIQISDLSGYWAQHFNGAKRVVQETPVQTNDTSDVEDLSGVRGEALPVAARVANSKHGRHNRHERARKGSTKSKSTRSKAVSANKSTKTTKASTSSKKSTSTKKKKQ